MKRRDFIKTTVQGGSTAAIIGGAASVAATEGVAAPAARAGQPNILFIMSDQQQWGTIAGRSQCNTPNLDRLARRACSLSGHTPPVLSVALHGPCWLLVLSTGITGFSTRSTQPLPSGGICTRTW